MSTLHRILSPIDFSEPSKRALRHALAIARWHESELTVLHVEDVLLYAASVEAGGYPGAGGEARPRNCTTSSTRQAGKTGTSGSTSLTGDAVSGFSNTRRATHQI